MSKEQDEMDSAFDGINNNNVLKMRIERNDNKTKKDLVEFYNKILVMAENLGFNVEVPTGTENLIKKTSGKGKVST